MTWHEIFPGIFRKGRLLKIDSDRLYNHTYATCLTGEAAGLACRVATHILAEVIYGLRVRTPLEVASARIEN